MISPNMILRPLYHIENENQSQNPARSNVSNPQIFGTVFELTNIKFLLVKGINFYRTQLVLKLPLFCSFTFCVLSQKQAAKERQIQNQLCLLKSYSLDYQKFDIRPLD